MDIYIYVSKRENDNKEKDAESSRKLLMLQWQMIIALICHHAHLAGTQFNCKKVVKEFF